MGHHLLRHHHPLHRVVQQTMLEQRSCSHCGSRIVHVRVRSQDQDQGLEVIKDHHRIQDLDLAHESLDQESGSKDTGTKDFGMTVTGSRGMIRGQNQGNGRGQVLYQGKIAERIQDEGKIREVEMIQGQEVDHEENHEVDHEAGLEVGIVVKAMLRNC